MHNHIITFTHKTITIGDNSEKITNVSCDCGFKARGFLDEAGAGAAAKAHRTAITVKFIALERNAIINGWYNGDRNPWDEVPI